VVIIKVIYIEKPQIFTGKLMMLPGIFLSQSSSGTLQGLSCHSLWLAR